MRQVAQKNGITFKIYAGTTGTLMAFDIADRLKDQFLGFAIKRKKEDKGWRWIQGVLQFKQVDQYRPINSNLAPIQKFRWSDYAVYPNTRYTYEVYAVHGTPDKLQYTQGPKLEIKTETLNSGTHQIIFNRAVAASQAYTRRFGDTNPDDENDPKHLQARKWLARGIIEKIEHFIRRAKNEDYALEVAIYEFEYEPIARALKAAHERGVQLKIVYHAKENDSQTADNEKHLALLPKQLCHPRKTTAIFHHKFIVLKKKDKTGIFKPRAILTGSTNFTPNGLWRQANVVHIYNSKTRAKEYSALFQQLLESKGRGDTKRYLNANNQPHTKNRSFCFFSPRSGYNDIDFLADAIKNAKSEVFICSAFKIHDKISEALAHPDNHKIHYGLQNSRTKITGLHRNRAFTVPTFLRSGLEGFLQESTKGQRGTIFIHLKTLIIDFASDNPTVIVGSHNFSKAASNKNDENFLVVHRNTDVADTYFCEMMRLYDHYRFRYNRKERKQQGIKSITLCPDNSWIEDYYDPNQLKFYERLRFAHSSNR